MMKSERAINIESRVFARDTGWSYDLHIFAFVSHTSCAQRCVVCALCERYVWSTRGGRGARGEGSRGGILGVCFECGFVVLGLVAVTTDVD